MRKFLALGAILLSLAGLAACVEDSGSGTMPQGTTLTDAERADCLDHNGTVGRGGLLPDEICIRPTPDAGQSCRKAGDCSGQCMAETRTCSKVTPQFGCFEFLDESGRSVGICID